MQKGIATLEIILVVLIIAILTTTTLPNIANILDKVTLDYETKRLYTNMRFLQSFDRMANMPDTHFETNTSDLVNTVGVVILPKAYITLKVSDLDPNKYYEQYLMPNGFNLAYKNSSVAPANLQFDYMGRENAGRSFTLKITSRLDKTFYFYFTTVGRFTADRVDRYP